MGANLVILNLLPAAIGGISGIILFIMVKKSVGALRALLACLLFLFSYGNLMSTLYYTGQELGLLFSLLGTFFFLQRKKGWGGLCAGLSAAASINMLVNCLVLTLTQWRWNRKYLPLFFGMMVGTFGAVQILFITIAGWTYVEQVYLYHLAKPDNSTWLASNAKVFWMMIHAHGLLIAFGLLGCLLSLRKWKNTEEVDGGEKKLVTLAMGMAGSQILFLMIIHPIFPHYFVSIVPFLAILAAEGVILGWEWTRALMIPQRILIIGTGIIMSILLVLSAKHTLRLYEIEQYLLGVPQVVEVAEVVRRGIPEDATIFGEFGIAPLVSLLSNRRLAANIVDSSEMRIMGKQTTMEEMTDAIEADNVQILVNRERRGINAYPPFWKYRDAHFFLSRTIQAEGFPTAIEIWRRK